MIVWLTAALVLATAAWLSSGFEWGWISIWAEQIKRRFDR